MPRQVVSMVRASSLRRSVLKLGDDLFDRGEVRGVGRQEQGFGAHSANGPRDRLPFVATEVVHDDHVARPEGWNEHLLDIGQKAATVDRAIDHARRLDAVPAQRGQECERAPAPARDFGHQPIAASATAMKACHIGLRPGLVDEDQAFGVNPALILLSLRPPARNVAAILFGGVQAFF